MIIGDARRFAIEFEILMAYRDTHFLAIGLLVFHIGGNEFGVRQPDATTFGNAVDGVDRLLRNQEKIARAELTSMPAFELADLYLDAFYRDDCRHSLRGEREKRQELFLSPSCLWPNFDREFDDGSHILFFGTEKDIRLLAFKNDEHNVGALAETVMNRADFEEVLLDWLAAFKSQRQSALNLH